MKANSIRFFSTLTSIFIAVTIGVVAPTAALAVCGDGEVDAGELCDDGNLADGDCCTSTCQRPTGCFETQRSALLVRDIGDDRKDKVTWRYFRGSSVFEDWGDPHSETSYSFCVWDDDELKIDMRIEPGGICHPRRPCWKTIGRGAPTGFFYFNKPTNSSGAQRLYINTAKPPRNSFISLRGLGVDLPFPGPIGFDRYFHQNTAVTIQFLRNDAPVCWEAVHPSANKNIFRRYKSLLYADRD